MTVALVLTPVGAPLLVNVAIPVGSVSLLQFESRFQSLPGPSQVWFCARALDVPRQRPKNRIARPTQYRPAG